MKKRIRQTHYAELDTYEELVDTAGESTDTDSTTEPEETTTHQLSVEQGYGAGTYEAGDVVHVFADFLPGNEVVTHWVEIWTYPPEWHHQFVMPEHDVTLTAHVEITDFALEEIEYPGVQGDIRIFYTLFLKTPWVYSFSFMERVGVPMSPILLLFKTSPPQRISKAWQS